MGGPSAEKSKVTRGIHDPGAEVVVPDTIRQDASRQRVLGGGEPSGETEPALAFILQVRQLIGGGARKRREAGGKHGLAFALWVAADERDEGSRRGLMFPHPPSRQCRNERDLGFEGSQLFVRRVERLLLLQSRHQAGFCDQGRFACIQRRFFLLQRLELGGARITLRWGGHLTIAVSGAGKG